MCARVWRASGGAMDRVATLDGQRGCGCSTATEVPSTPDVASTRTRATAPRNAQRVPRSGRAACFPGLLGRAPEVPSGSVPLVLGTCYSSTRYFRVSRSKLRIQHRIVMPGRRCRLDLRQQIALDRLHVEWLEHAMELGVVAHAIAHPRVQPGHELERLRHFLLHPQAHLQTELLP